MNGDLLIYDYTGPDCGKTVSASSLVSFPRAAAALKNVVVKIPQPHSLGYNVSTGHFFITIQDSRLELTDVESRCIKVAFGWIVRNEYDKLEMRNHVCLVKRDDCELYFYSHQECGEDYLGYMDVTIKDKKQKFYIEAIEPGLKQYSSLLNL